MYLQFTLQFYHFTHFSQCFARKFIYFNSFSYFYYNLWSETENRMSLRSPELKLWKLKLHCGEILLKRKNQIFKNSFFMTNSIKYCLKFTYINLRILFLANLIKKKSGKCGKMSFWKFGFSYWEEFHHSEVWASIVLVLLNVETCGFLFLITNGSKNKKSYWNL